MTKWVTVRYDLCLPASCDPKAGACRAASACTHRVLIQEGPFDAPLLLYRDLCVGCADCARACPLEAIRR